MDTTASTAGPMPATSLLSLPYMPRAQRESAPLRLTRPAADVSGWLRRVTLLGWRSNLNGVQGESCTVKQ